MKIGKLIVVIAAILVPAMGLEAAVLYFLLSGAPAPVSPSVEAKPPEEDTAVDDAAEVAIDSFNCTNNRVAPGSVVHVSFKMVAIVPESQKKSFDDRANKALKTRVRQGVERIVRSAALEDLHDPSLVSLKRMLREEVNKVLSKSQVSEVIIHDYRLMEQ